MTIKSIPTLILALAAIAAALGLSAPASHATAGAEPWCLNDDEGNGHCNYPSSQACLAAVAGGTRGFCNQNPSGGSSPAAAVAPQQRKRRAH